MNQRSHAPNGIRTTPKDVFLHLLSIATLYAAVVSFIVLLFQYVSELLPDPLLSYERTGNLDAIRSTTATLIVVFPVYIFTSWLIYRDIASQPGKADVRVRKWLIYLTLFIASITIIVDLVALIYNFLSGDLTTRFALKVLVVLVTAAAVFGYYIWDLRRRDFRPGSTRIVAWASAAAVLASIVLGFFVVGSPFYQRQVRFDERRVSDLQTIQGQIVTYWQSKSALPAALGDLNDSISGFRAPADPSTGRPYEYRKTGNLSFELCALFSTSQEDQSAKSMPVPAYDSYQQNWSHAAGRVCFSRRIDPDLYRPQPPPPFKR